MPLRNGQFCDGGEGWPSPPHFSMVVDTFKPYIYLWWKILGLVKMSISGDTPKWNINEKIKKELLYIKCTYNNNVSVGR